MSLQRFKILKFDVVNPPVDFELGMLNHRPGVMGSTFAGVFASSR